MAAVARRNTRAVREDLAAIRGEAEMAIARGAKRYSARLRRQLDAEAELDETQRTVDAKFMKDVLIEMCDFWNVDPVSIAAELHIDRSTVFRWKAGTSKPKQYACVGLIRGFVDALDKHYGLKR